MFADDIILFTKVTRRKSQALNGCLDKYCQWFGRKINREKSGLIFSKSIQKQKARELKSLMQMRKLKEDAVYLGAPLFLTRNKSKDFHFLQDKLEARL